MPDIYKYSFLEQKGDDEEEESVLIPDVWLPSDERQKQQEAQEQAQIEEQERLQQLEAAQQEEVRAASDEQEIQRRVAEQIDALQDQLRREVHQEVYAEVLAQKTAEVNQHLQRVDTILVQMQQEQTQFMEQFRDRLARLSIDVAEKLIMRKIEEDDMFLSDLVTKTVNSLKNSEWVTVEVSDELVNLVSYLREEFKSSEYGNVEVAARYHPDDTCIIETDGGVIDASISKQIANVRKEFDSVE